MDDPVEFAKQVKTFRPSQWMRDFMDGKERRFMSHDRPRQVCTICQERAFIGLDRQGVVTWLCLEHSRSFRPERKADQVVFDEASNITPEMWARISSALEAD